MTNLRHLNKIVFIQSADIDYQEIALDGNVHFIGDQGAGKSTILRAILFLYTANMRKLGIGKGSSSFLNYYFQEPAATIIYEIKTSYSTFLVWLKKEGNRIAYRFINASYAKSFFLEKTPKGFRPSKTDDVKSRLRGKIYMFLSKYLAILVLEIFFMVQRSTRLLDLMHSYKAKHIRIFRMQYRMYF